MSRHNAVEIGNPDIKTAIISCEQGAPRPHSLLIHFSVRFVIQIARFR